MQKTLLIAILLLPMTLLGQVIIHSHCPVVAPSITPHLFSVRLYQDDGGWRPGTKMSVDFSVKNVGTRTIKTMSFLIRLPSDIRSGTGYTMQNVPLDMEAGSVKTLHYRNLIDVFTFTHDNTVRIDITQIRFADGEIYDASCNLGTPIIPPPILSVTPKSPSVPQKLTDEMSPPRLLDYKPTEFNAIHSALQETTKIVTFSIVVETDGAVRDVKLVNGTEIDQINKSIERSVANAYFTPALLNGKPIAVTMPINVQVSY